MTESRQLLAEYANNGSEAAFRELVARYINFVYSTALRLVERNTQLAEDVTQTVFIDLSRMTKTLSTDIMLGGWLHQHTFHVATKAARGELRRQAREREASEMNMLQNNSDAGLRDATLLLDEAITQLPSEDRTAILLRFFEQRDFRSVGEALGTSEDSARMRVNRAVDKLHGLLKQRGVTLSAAALGTALATEAVTAAPAGLAGAVTAAALAGTTLATTATATAAKAIAMTTLQKTLVTVTVAVLAGAGIYEARQAANARAELQTLQQQQTSLTEQIQQSRREHEGTVPQAKNPQSPPDDKLGELLKVRGRVGVLQTEVRDLARSNYAFAASNTTMSNLLAGVGDRIRTNSIQRTNVFLTAALQDVGMQTPDLALVTVLRALTSGDADAMRRILDPASQMLEERGMTIFDKQATMFQRVFQIKLSQEQHYLDGSVDFNCDLKTEDNVQRPAETQLLVLHMRPSDQGWRLYRYTAPRVVFDR